MPDLSSKKILLVEDELPILTLLKSNLTAQGFKVLTATDGSAGLAMATKNIPDLILLDILMPKMNGMTMLKKLRSNNMTAEIPVILLTNLMESKYILDAKDYGVEDYFIKSDISLGKVINLIVEKTTTGNTIHISPGLPN